MYRSAPASIVIEPSGTFISARSTKNCGDIARPGGVPTLACVRTSREPAVDPSRSLLVRSCYGSVIFCAWAPSPTVMVTGSKGGSPTAEAMSPSR